MRRNKKLEEDIGRTLYKFCGEKRQTIVEPLWPSLRAKIMAVIIVLVILGGVFLMNDAYKKGYAKGKLDALNKNLTKNGTYPVINSQLGSINIGDINPLVPLIRGGGR